MFATPQPLMHPPGQSATPIRHQMANGTKIRGKKDSNPIYQSFEPITLLGKTSVSLPFCITLSICDTGANGT